MKKFIRNTLFFGIVCLLVLFGVLELTSLIVEHRDFKNWETESNTLVMRNDKHYNLMISGISHARVFSRHSNHQRIESILDRSIINIGQGYGGCGMNEQLFYLKHFYHRGNTVDELLYFLSPPMMYSEKLPIVSKTFNYEKFDLLFLRDYLKFPSENKNERIFHYITSKFHPRWWLERPDTDKILKDSLTTVDTAAVMEGLRVAYGTEMSYERFVKSQTVIIDLLSFCKENGIEVTFVVPPAVFGKWPGHEEVLSFMDEMHKEYDFELYDHAAVMLEPSFYYDHHHLNTKGVVHFTENYLKADLDHSPKSYSSK